MTIPSERAGEGRAGVRPDRGGAPDPTPGAGLREALLEVTRRAPILLGDASARVRDFFRARRNADGGFRGRGRSSDLYYTAFGTGALCAFDDPPAPATRDYLTGFGAGDALDFVHLISLTRCWVNVAGAVPAALRVPLRRRLEDYRSADGGFRDRPGERLGSAYGAFLALGAREDLGETIAAESWPPLLSGLRAGDGGYANLPGQALGITTLTAGVVTLQRHCDTPPDPAAMAWLRDRLHPGGGFCPTPEIPLPDLLSTAVALHALAEGDGPLPAAVRDPCLRFLDTVWDERRAAFRGHALDPTVDVEYTWYGLLAAGHLARADGGTGAS